MNAFCAVGRLTRDPITRFEGEGIQTATATLLIEEPGKLKPFQLFVPLSFWGKSAEQASTLGAQDMIGITGKLCWKKLHSKTGEEKSSLVVEVKTVEVLQAAAIVGEVAS
jgi:single-stranded DNA-binding protein